MALPLSDLLMIGGGEKKLAACLVLLLLELFLEGTYFKSLSSKASEIHVIVSRSGAESTASPADIENHLELGKEFLARGQLSDALTHYHAAVGKYNWLVHTKESEYL